MPNIPKDKKIIVFDGVCVLCNRYVKFIARHDKKDCFRFVTIQNKEMLKKFNLKNNMKINPQSILLINHDNSVKTKSLAIISILSKLSFPFYLFKILKILPRNILDSIYDFIAAKRYKFFGKIENCSLINSSEANNIKKKMIS